MSAPPPEAHRAARRVWILTVAMAVLSAVPLWLTSVVPTTDGPAHLYNAWLLLHLDDPRLEAGRFVQVNAFVPNWGGVGPLVPLLLLLPPAVAEKVWLGAVVVLLVLGMAALAARLGGDPLLSGASAGILAHGWLLAVGFTGFLASLGLGLLVCAMGAGLLAAPPEGRSPWRSVVGLGLAFAVLFFVHLAGAILAAGIWLLLSAGRCCDGLSLRRTVSRGAAPLLLLAVLLVGHWAGREGRSVPQFRPGSESGWSRLVELPSGAYWEAYSVADRRVGAALVLLTLGLLLARATRSSPSVGGARWLAWGAGGVLAAYLTLPWAAGGGAFLTDRLVLPLLFLPLPWATSFGLPARGLFRTALALLLVGALAHRTAQYRIWGSVTRSVVDLNRGLPEGRLLVQPPPPPLPMAVNPLTHIWGRVGIERGSFALDNYEAFLVGWFPLSFRREGEALAAAWRDSGIPPPGAVVLRYE